MCACVAQAGAARAVAIGVGDAACVDRGRLLALAARGVMDVQPGGVAMDAAHWR